MSTKAQIINIINNNFDSFLSADYIIYYDLYFKPILLNNDLIGKHDCYIENIDAEEETITLLSTETQQTVTIGLENLSMNDLKNILNTLNEWLNDNGRI